MSRGEEELRIAAIMRYLIGEAPHIISRDLNRSKVWFFKWLKHYHWGDIPSKT